MDSEKECLIKTDEKFQLAEEQRVEKGCLTKIKATLMWSLFLYDNGFAVLKRLKWDEGYEYNHVKG